MIEECGGKISQRRRDAIKKADWRLNKQDLDQQQDYFSYNNNEEAQQPEPKFEERTLKI